MKGKELEKLKEKTFTVENKEIGKKRVVSDFSPLKNENKKKDEIKKKRRITAESSNNDPLQPKLNF